MLKSGTYYRITTGWIVFHIKQAVQKTPKLFISNGYYL